MSLLFVCQANVGRSQAAMELYRQRGGQADSAGTKVDAPGATLAERPGAGTIVGIMRDEYGIDMNHNVRTQLTEAVASRYDKLIVMAESETWPEWLKSDPRVVHWKIQDTKGQDVATTRRIVHEIDEKVKDLEVS